MPNFYVIHKMAFYDLHKYYVVLHYDSAKKSKNCIIVVQFCFVLCYVADAQ